jgi:hypothetical protein
LGNSFGDETGSGSTKEWEIIANKLSKAGFSLGWVSAFDREGHTIWIVDAHRNGKCFIVRAEEILTAFVELEKSLQGLRQRRFSKLGDEQKLV